MITMNRGGLSQKQFEKVLKPYAKNSGPRVDFKQAGISACEYLDEHPTLLDEVGKLLDEVHE